MTIEWNYVPRSPTEMKLNKPYAAVHLFHAVNEYRQARGLVPVSYSRALSYVALVHAWDVMVNMQGRPPKGGNLHSWSGVAGRRVVYSEDHKQASGMWDKPQELGTGYRGSGFEISYKSSRRPGDTTSGEQLARQCVEGWKSSAGHHEVMINAGVWAARFEAMGAGWYVNEHGVYACVWFGKESDGL